MAEAGGCQASSLSVKNQIDDGYPQWMVKKSLPDDILIAREKMKQQRQAEKQSLLTELKYCSIRRDLLCGSRIHAKAVDSRHDSDMFVLTALIRMYAKCGSMVDARRVFDNIQKPDIVSWSVLLLGYAHNGDGHTALELFSRMKALSGYAPKSVTYVAALKACTSLAVKGDQNECLKRGKEIHTEIGHQLDHYVQSALIEMYAKCGSMGRARQVFDSVHNPDVVCWNVLLLGYVENRNWYAALEMFSRMKARGCMPSSVTFVAVLKACASLSVNGDCDGKRECLRRGQEIHIEIGKNMDYRVQSALIDMYSKCSNMGDARRVFDSLHKPDVVCWNVLILGYAENADGLAALELFSRMKACGCVPDSVTYVAALKACTCMAVKGDDSRKGDWLERGRNIHLEIGSHLNLYVQNTLVDMYAKCGSLTDARRIFDSTHEPDVVSWNSLIRGYAENGEGHAALELFSRMKACGCVPESMTYVAALKACTLDVDGSQKGFWLEWGRTIHSEIGCRLDYYVQSALIDMYGKCDSMVEARAVFESIGKPNVVCWNALLSGYAENGDCLATLNLFERMKTCGCVPSSVTYVIALKACTFLAVNGNCGGKGDYLELGRQLHSEIGLLDHYVQSALIDMYAKCDSMVDARRIFDRIQNPDAVSWNALLLGYVEKGDGLTVLDLLSRMKTACGCEPNSVTYIAALKACGLTGALALGRRFHSDISTFTSNVVTCLVDFYAKCGSMVEACEVFDFHSTGRVVPTWNALLAGYGNFGDIDSVFNLFEAMQDQGFQPDAVTFVCVLSCCSRAGLVAKAREYFDAMHVQYGVTPSVTHYNCMVDILGRGNQLDEAIALLREMPCNPDAVTWMTLLGACRKWKNAEIGRWAFQSLVDMDKKNDVHIHGIKDR